MAAPRTKTIHLVIDEALLAEVDALAEAGQESRSAFTRAALQAEIRRRKTAQLDEAHRRSYLEQPDDDIWQPIRRAWGDESGESSVAP